ncbi:MAG: DnaA/Hda family protein [Thermodesulfobacteriota bacterium]
MIPSAFRRTMGCMDQLVLSLSTPPRYSFESLVVHEGIQHAVMTIHSTYATPKRPLPSLFLHGLPGTGKTHLLNALAELLREVFREEGLRVEIVSVESLAADAAFDELLANPDGTADLCGVVVDNIHEAQGQTAAHIWNLSNKLTRSGAALLMSSRKIPEETFPNDPHMTSRITSGLVLELQAPDDAVRVLIIDKMARDRSIRISRDVAHYLVTHKSRNISDLSKIIGILDHASLRLKRRITIPLIKSLEKDGEL